MKKPPSLRNKLISNNDYPDRTSPMANCSDGDHELYWNASADDKQRTLHDVYEQIDPMDHHATFRDHNLRELEIGAFRKRLTSQGNILDLGCGNGYTLLRLAEELDWPMTGVDFSESLIKGGRKNCEDWSKPLKSKPHFIVQDCIKYISEAAEESLDYVLSERFILNLPDRKTQHGVIANIYRSLKPGGRYLMCEGSMTGFEALNDLREELDLDRIPATSAENLSSLRFEDAEIEDFFRNLGFKIAAKEGFSLYFIISRIVHPWLLSPESPKFKAPINEIAGLIQAQQPLQSGLGSNTLWVLEKT